MLVRKILFITLSNIGDVVLTLPVLDTLRENFVQAKITVLVGERPKEIFEDNPNIHRVIIYNKRAKLSQKLNLFNKLKLENFDLVVDLRNSFFGAFLPAKYKTSPFLTIPKAIEHMKERHLYKIQNLTTKEPIGKSLHINTEKENHIRGILEENKITDQDEIVVVAPGARSHIKRWNQDKFTDLIKQLIDDFKVKVVLVGDKEDLSIASHITGNLQYPILDLSGKTSILQLTCLLQKSKLVLTNDSAILHLASYLNRPVVAIFGPTNEIKYGPWSDNCATVKKEIYCRPCEKAQCKLRTLDCMKLIKIEDVLRKVRKILNKENRVQSTENREKYKRILIVRTDRIGDVLLSTPVIKAARDAYPDAYIAMMVSPYAKDIVEDNPYLDQVIIYDKNAKHKSWLSSINFALNLRKKRFDLAIVLHPTKRVHLITFFTRIKRRIGYDRKLGILLTDRIKHTKQFGEKHELEYNLDLLRRLDIEPKDKDLFMPIEMESERWVDELFMREGIKVNDKLLAIHPGASCPSKIWPNDRFAKLSDMLITKFKIKVLIIAGPRDIAIAENVIRQMQNQAVNLAGKTSVSQLASVLKRCQLFISNDSGPVHIASAVGVPVISIFGRNQRGLSPDRWRPVGKKDKVIHKEVGCIECLAHNCVKDFACLKAISVEDVLTAVDSIL